MHTLQAIADRMHEHSTSFPSSKSFEAMHAAACALQKQGDMIGAASTYTIAIQTLGHKTHPRLFITLCNRAVVYNALELPKHALQDAQRARVLTTRALQRCVYWWMPLVPQVMTCTSSDGQRI